MSNNTLPIRSPSARAQQGQIPGMQAVRPAPNEAMISLAKVMGEGFRGMGEQLLRFPNSDPAEMARFTAMIRKSQAAIQGGMTAPQEPQVGQQRGAPRPPADRQIDPVTGMPMGGATAGAAARAPIT